MAHKMTTEESAKAEPDAYERPWVYLGSAVFMRYMSEFNVPEVNIHANLAETNGATAAYVAALRGTAAMMEMFAAQRATHREARQREREAYAQYQKCVSELHAAEETLVACVKPANGWSS